MEIRKRNMTRRSRLLRVMRMCVSVVELRSADKPGYGYYMEKALEYLDRFWDGLFRYRIDGEYPIDNNAA